MRKLLLPVSLSVGLAVTVPACGSDENTQADSMSGLHDAGTDAKSEDSAEESSMSVVPLTCENEAKTLVAAVQAAKECGADTDCTYAMVFTPVWEFCSPGFYVNATADLKTLKAEASTYGDCVNGTIPGCLGQLPTTGHCWKSKCWGADLDSTKSEKNNCYDQLSSKNECGLCACGNCGRESCFGNAECKQLYECHEAAGCLGNAACSGVTNPCSSIESAVATVSFQQFQNFRSCIIKKGCGGWCRPN